MSTSQIRFWPPAVLAVLLASVAYGQSPDTSRFAAGAFDSNVYHEAPVRLPLLDFELPNPMADVASPQATAAAVPGGRTSGILNGPGFEPFASSDFSGDSATLNARRGTPTLSSGVRDQISWQLPIDADRLSGPPPEKRVTFQSMFSAQWQGVLADHQAFYSPESLAWLGAGLGVGAVMANTGFDENFLRDTYVENIILAPNDEYREKIHEAKFIGDGYYTLPAFAVAALAEPWIQDLPLGSETSQWGQRSLRTILVGGPPMLGLQYLTGASRPGESPSRSHWQPLQDNNGVSGHSFMGAVPFLSAAKMTDRPWLKGSFYLASTLPALSRVNDDDHYFSQAFLGWWIAYLASTAVDSAHHPASNRRWFVYTQRDAVGVGFEFVQ
ncbi:MAG: hypothetical protein KDA42_10320 [Planctomycetales bacterium]|nr:hypothetical protein [Planctomycetales bacterium]